MSTATTATIDRAEIVKALGVLSEPGNVVENRVLESRTTRYYAPHTESGYFDSAEKLAKAAATIDMAKGWYITLNPVAPALLSRAANRIRPAGREPLTSDGDIVRRKWLPIDIDPRRPAGISSSDEEHQEALDFAYTVAQHLHADGWPDPIIGDSGNGAHLLYRIDLPTDDDGLVERTLKGLAARFGAMSERADIDTTVHNPARIWKLYGTPACKGDNTPERPHRLARLLEVPDALEVVPVGLLESIATAKPEARREQSYTGNGQHTGNGHFDLTEWIARHNLRVGEPKPWQGGRRWIFDVCPWDSSHTDRSAYIVQHASGAIAAGCQHNGCQGRNWHDLRELFDGPREQRRYRHAIAGGTTGTTEKHDGPQEWPELIPFDEVDLPTFPTDALPPVLREWVEAEAEATQTPADLAGLLALSVCSAVLARRVEVEPRPGWREPGNEYMAILLEPGNRKSAVFADATAPLREIESEEIEAARHGVARAQSDRRQDEARLKKLEKTAAEKGDREAAHEARELAADLASRPEAVLPRRIIDNATPERVEMILAEQGGRIASMSPEGGVFDLMGGMYSKSGATQFDVYLKGHSGDDILTDRVGRKSVHVARPALTCAYAMQPAVIQGLADTPAFRARGLLARFLYAAPKSRIGSRTIAPQPVVPEVYAAYHNTIQRLNDVYPESGNCGNSVNVLSTHVFTLSPEAQAAFIEWETQIETMLRDGGDMENIRDWGAKLAGATLRIATVIHAVKTLETGSGTIGTSTIRGAVKIAIYLIPHAKAVLAMMTATESQDDQDARYLLRWIERHGKAGFAKRDAYRHCKSRFSKPEDIDPALTELTKRGYIRPTPTESPRPGRPASPVYELNPDFSFSGN